MRLFPFAHRSFSRPARRCLLLLPMAAALALLSACYMLQPRVKVGKLAPKLTIDRWFQAPPNASASWASLHGKVVVLNFWEPWNQDCTDSLPHLNALAKHYENNPNVQFIHITSEETTETVTQFTDIIPIRGWIAMDPDKTVSTTYGVHGYPDTWLIDAEGRVVAITTPKFVTEKVIDGVLEGRVASPVKEGFID